MLVIFHNKKDLRTVQVFFGKSNKRLFPALTKVLGTECEKNPEKEWKEVKLWNQNILFQADLIWGQHGKLIEVKKVAIPSR